MAFRSYGNNQNSSNMRASDATPSPANSDNLNCVADMPVPTPPPMHDLFTTTRYDFPNRGGGGYGYRRLLTSHSTDFGHSPILSRSNTWLGSSQNLPTHNVTSNTSKYLRHDQIYHSPYPIRRNYHETPRCKFGSMEIDKKSKDSRKQKKFANVQEFENYMQERFQITQTKPNKYLHDHQQLSKEMEEVQNLSQELKTKYQDTKEPRAPNEDQRLYCNDHYISDIDENEEIKQFCFGFPTRRYSDIHPNQEKTFQASSYKTLPLKKNSHVAVSPAVSIPIQTNDERDSFSSMKSSEFGDSPEKDHRVSSATSTKILKSPQKTIVKIAKIR